jgi:phosphomannomutase/phosphoglucomutase
MLGRGKKQDVVAKSKKPRRRRPTGLPAWLWPVVTLAALGGVAWQAMNMELLQEAPPGQRGDARPIAARAAQQLGNEFAKVRDELERLIVNERLNLVPADTTFLVLDGPQWQLPHLLRARLVSDKVDRIDDDVAPVLSYACQDLLKSAYTGDEPLLLEVHRFGSDQQHIDIVRRVRAPDGSWSGAVIAAYNVALLQQILNQVESGGAYLELRQANLMLASQGPGNLRAGSPYTLPVAGTRWQVAVWAPLAAAQPSRSVNWPNLAIVSALAVLVLVGGGAMSWRAHKQRAAVPKPSEPQPPEPAPVIEPQAAEPATAEDMVEDVLFQESEGLIVVSDEQAATEPATATPAIDPAIFKAYDIRGMVGKNLTEEVVRQIGLALGSEAQARGQNTIAVGRDGRNSGPPLMRALLEGLKASGINVLDVGMVPTPVLYYAAWEKAQGTGVMLTGSHNPPDYNGLKMVIGYTTLAGADIQNLRQRIEQQDFVSDDGKLESIDIIDDYIERIAGRVMLLRPFKIVVDCGNGVAGVVAPKLFKTMGCEVLELYSEVDGNFPHHHPDPSRPENLQALRDAVQAHQADIGFAFDGDGDRLGVVTSDGNIIWPDRLMMLFADDILKRNPGAEIIFDVKCSKNLASEIEKHGGKPIMWNTGHSLIKKKMQETSAPFAGEMSGHIFFKDRWYGFDDAIYTAARLLELLGPKSRGGPVKDVFAALPDSINTPELHVRMAEGEHHAFMQQFIDKARFEDARVITIDGLRAEFADGWGLVRASNTTPVLVLRFEADSQEALDRIKDAFRTQMLAVNDKLELPF